MHVGGWDQHTQQASHKTGGGQPLAHPVDKCTTAPRHTVCCNLRHGTRGVGTRRLRGTFAVLEQHVIKAGPDKTNKASKYSPMFVCLGGKFAFHPQCWACCAANGSMSCREPCLVLPTRRVSAFHPVIPKLSPHITYRSFLRRAIINYLSSGKETLTRWKWDAARRWALPATEASAVLLILL